MAFSYNKKNLANTTISGSLAASATSVTVNDASVFPLGYFYATLMPSYEISEFGNSEIVLVTNITGNVLTIARAQNGTTARAFNDGSIITNGIYTQDMDMAQAVGKKIFNASWDSEAGYYKINDPMLKIVPDEGTSIRAVFDTDVPSGTYAALSVNENTEGGTATKIGKNIEIRDANALAPVSVGLGGDTTQQASPTPVSPQEVQTVTGRQLVTITDGGSESREYEVNLGKNLLDPSAVSLSTTASFSGTSGNTFTTSSNSYRDFVVFPVEPNTSYSISASGSGYGSYTQFYIGELLDKKTEAGKTWGWITGSYTFVTGPLTRFLGVIIRPRNSSGDISTQTLQLIKDCQIQFERSPATNYSEYFTPIELCKMGTAQDYIYKSGGDWYIHKATNRLNLQDYSGLAWWKSGSSIKITWEYMTIPTAVVPSSMNNAGETYCDHFTNGPAQEIWNGTRPVGYGLGPDGFYFNNNYSTANDFKTYIGNTPVYVYYALATPTDTQITNADLIAQLEALASATLYEGQNNITVSGYLAGYLNLTYNTINSGVYVVNIVNGAYILDNNTRNPAPVKAGLPYDLTYYNGNWYIMNMIGEV